MPYSRRSRSTRLASKPWPVTKKNASTELRQFLAGKPLRWEITADRIELMATP